MRRTVALLGLLVAMPSAAGLLAAEPLDAAVPQPPALLMALAEAPPARWEDFLAPAALVVPHAPLGAVLLPAPMLPSEGVRGVLEEAGLLADAADASVLAAYDALPAPQRDALGLLLAAHLEDARLVREAYANAPSDLLDRDWGNDLLDAPVDWTKLVEGQRLLLAATQAALPALRELPAL
ncbi:MAG TPA: hypothetical protein VGR28_02280, partial [Candidatus Thermoplasmatota archaeon]|nr:hypothetical protein [Candidatus Thermoplasmatota archaeon]